MATEGQLRAKGKYFKKKLNAKEVLRLYQAGERNFQGVILRGQSFMGQDLSEADFSEADIRSTNFSGTKLIGAKFVGAKCGLQKRWLIVLVILCWMLAIISGFFSLLEGFVVASAFHSLEPNFHIMGKAALLTLPILLTVIVSRGIGAIGFTTLILLIVIGAIGFVVIVLLVFIMGKSGASELGEVIAGILLSIVFTIPSLEIGALSVSATSLLSKKSELVSILFLILVSVVCGAGVVATQVGNELKTISLAAFSGLVLVITAIYLGKRTIKKKVKSDWLFRLSIAFAATKGTSFNFAYLTIADFAMASLKSTDFRKAILVGTYWNKAKKLDYVRPGNTYLQDSQIIQWITGKKASCNFDKKDLRGVNLQGVNLSSSTFINADLSEADLRGATLTGTCIQDWNINSETKLDNVNCDYVYLKSGQQERRPSDHSKNFQPGEFAKLVGKSLNTVDLIFKKGVDWKAVAYSLKNTQVLNEDTPLAIQSIENKGDGVVLIKVNVPQNADKGKIEGDFWQGYEFANKTLKEQYEARLLDKDKYINQLFYSLNKAQEKLGEVPKLMAEQPKFQQNFNAPVYGNAQNVEGNQNIYASEPKQSITEVATEIVKLLDYFEQNDPPITEAQQMVKTSTENQPEILDAEIG